jgi:hypothetical protein
LVPLSFPDAVEIAEAAERERVVAESAEETRAGGGRGGGREGGRERERVIE